MRELEHSRPADIEAESFRIIGAELEERGIVLPADQAPLVKRAIHTTADFDYARNLVFTPGAVEAGVRALRAGTPILTDTNMARSGINRGALERLGVTDAQVTVVDKGALDCTLKARVECAVFRSCGQSAQNIPWGGVVR